jgi:SAM-dependent methyltransferase
VSAHEWGTAPEFVGPRHRLRERLLLDLFLGCRPGRAVLNVGAGQGTFTELLEARGFEVASTDVSQAACDVLSARVRGPVVRADATELPFADERFDAVVLGEVLEHVQDDVAALRECRRVLRPGGCAALSVPAHPTWFGPSDEWAGHVRRYTRESLLAACRAAGLDAVRCRGWGFPVSAAYHRWVYDKRAAALADSGGWSPAQRASLRILEVALQLDRLFLGVERGALGFLLLAQRPDRPRPEPRELGGEVEAEREEHERVGEGEGEGAGERDVEHLPEHG